MPITPIKLKEILGENVLHELFLLIEERSIEGRQEILSRLDKVESNLSGLKTEFVEFRREVNQRFENINQRFDNIHERFDRFQKDINARFDTINERFDNSQKDINARLDALNERFDRMHEHMASMIKWTIGTLALFGTLITILLAISQFLK